MQRSISGSSYGYSLAIENNRHNEAYASCQDHNRAALQVLHQEPGSWADGTDGRKWFYCMPRVIVLRLHPTFSGFFFKGGLFFHKDLLGMGMGVPFELLRLDPGVFLWNRGKTPLNIFNSPSVFYPYWGQS